MINCVVKHGNKILLVQRSNKLKFYPGYWNGISGFLDDRKSLEQKVKEELREELGIKASGIKKIKRGDIFHQEEPRYGKTWIIHPVLAEVKNGKVKLDWEASRYKWVKPGKAKKFKLLPGFDRVLYKLPIWP